NARQADIGRRNGATLGDLPAPFVSAPLQFVEQLAELQVLLGKFGQMANLAAPEQSLNGSHDRQNRCEQPLFLVKMIRAQGNNTVDVFVNHDGPLCRSSCERIMSPTPRPPLRPSRS